MQELDYYEAIDMLDWWWQMYSNLLYKDGGNTMNLHAYKLMENNQKNLKFLMEATIFCKKDTYCKTDGSYYIINLLCTTRLS